MKSQNQIQTPILPLTRLAAALLLPALLTAGVLLYGWPDRTAELFAWTIQPRLTPLLMGAAYLAGFYFFLRVLLAQDWETVRLGFIPIAVFALLAGVATLLHWDRFNHRHPTFYAWVFLYTVSPLLIPALWLINRRSTGRGTPQAAPGIAAPLPAVLLLAGAVILITGMLLYLAPQAMSPAWPWVLTPLTARIVGSFYILTGLVDLRIGLNRGWRAARVLVESQLIGLGLLLGGVWRALDNLDWRNPISYLFSVGMAVLMILGVIIYLRRGAGREQRGN